MSRSFLPSTCDPHERIEPPAAVEDGSRDGWRLFEELQESAEETFKDTVQAEADICDLPDEVLTAPRLVDVMGIARRYHRACPSPSAWQQLHALLPVRYGLCGRVSAPKPFTGENYRRASAMQKRLRLREQIEWAGKTGALVAVYDFLRALPETQWEHF